MKGIPVSPVFVKEHRWVNKKNKLWIFTQKRPTIHDEDAWNAYWASQGQSWRTQPMINTERQKYLTERLRIIPDFRNNIYPLKDIKLNRADVEWLVDIYTKENEPLDQYIIGTRAHGLDLRGANLRFVDLSRVPLTQVRGGLNTTEWMSGTREQREAAAIHLEGANLSRADLRWAILRSAHLEGTNLTYVHLEGASLLATHLEGNREIPAAADLRNATFNEDTVLEEAIFGNKEYGFVQLADIKWNNANLALVNWEQVTVLGDEREACRDWTQDRQKKDKLRRLHELKRAIRANRQLSLILQIQGLSEEAAYFAYHAHLLKRIILRFQGIRFLGQYLFSLFLDLLAGYGYKPGRTLLWYITTVSGFAWAYYFSSNLSKHPLTLVASLIFSITAFHGRGFLPGGFGYGDLTTIIAAIEAVAGLLIELSFIATFTQRFFGK